MTGLLAVLAVSFSLQRLDLDLKVNYQAQRIDGTARMTIRNATSEPASVVPLLLHRLMTISNAGGLAVEQRVVIFDHDPKLQVDYATITLPKAVAPGETANITVAWGGPLVGYAETSSPYIKDHIADDFTIIREDAWAFPALGVPWSKVYRARPRADFTFDARVNVPSGEVVAAGGTLVDAKEQDGRTTFHFASDAPAPFLNITVAKYKTLDRDGIRIYYLPASEKGAAIVMDETQKALDWYAKTLGPLRAAPRFTIMEIPDGYGAQANLVAGIMIESFLFRDHDYFAGLYHELGHFWNGGDAEIPSPRWNEGLSTWFQEVLPEVIDQTPSPWLAPRILAKAAKAAGEGGEVTRVPLRDYGKANLTDWSYNIGYLYFRVVEKKIGRPALLAVLRDYFQAHAATPGTLRDFTALLEKRYPETRAIDADWIETTGWTAKVTKASSFDALAASY